MLVLFFNIQDQFNVINLYFIFKLNDLFKCYLYILKAIKFLLIHKFFQYFHLIPYFKKSYLCNFEALDIYHSHWLTKIKKIEAQFI